MPVGICDTYTSTSANNITISSDIIRIDVSTNHARRFSPVGLVNTVEVVAVADVT